MAGRVVLINPARHFIANAHGLGYLIPLGLVSIGGPLIDAGFTVRLIDHDLYRWSYRRLIQEISNFKADYILLGHSGSTAAHKTAIKTIKAIHEKLPHLRVVYRGVYPSYADRAVMTECEEIDIPETWLLTLDHTLCHLFSIFQQRFDHRLCPSLCIDAQDRLCP